MCLKRAKPRKSFRPPQKGLSPFEIDFHVQEVKIAGGKARIKSQAQRRQKLTKPHQQNDNGTLDCDTTEECEKK